MNDHPQMYLFFLGCLLIGFFLLVWFVYSSVNDDWTKSDLVQKNKQDKSQTSFSQSRHPSASKPFASPPPRSSSPPQTPATFQSRSVSPPPPPIVQRPLYTPPPVATPPTGGNLHLNPESVLKAKYGYSVAQGVSLGKRRTALHRAITDKQGGLTLEQVATHIALLVTLRKKWPNPPWDAIARWEEDLAWLHSTYYVPYRYTFRWPRT